MEGRPQDRNVRRRCLCGRLVVFAATLLPFLVYLSARNVRRYYLRTRAAADAIQFTVDQEALKKKADSTRQAEIACSLSNKEGCIMCSG